MKKLGKKVSESRIIIVKELIWLDNYNELLGIALGRRYEKVQNKRKEFKNS